MNSKTKKAVRAVVTVLLTVLAIFSSFSLCGTVLIDSILSQDQLYAEARASRWADGVREEVTAYFAARNAQTEIPQEVTDAFLEEKVTDDICMQFWTGKFADFPFQELTDDLADRIHKCALQMRAKGEIDFSDEEWAAFEKSLPETAEDYVGAVRRFVHVNSYSSLKTTVTDYWNKLFIALLVGSIVLTAGSFAALLAIHRRKRLQVAYVVLASTGLDLLIPAIWLKASGFAARFQVTPAYVKRFIERIYDTGTTRLLEAGVILLALGLICGVAIIFWNIKHTRKKRHPGEYHGKTIFE